MSRLRRVAAAAGRCVVWLLPIGRGEWAEAFWTEADAVPPGRPRLAWRAGGLRLVTGEILTWHRVGRVLLFAAAAALMAWATWPGAAAGTVAAFARADVITTMLLLTVLPVVARRLFGPVQPSQARPVPPRERLRGDPDPGASQGRSRAVRVHRAAQHS